MTISHRLHLPVRGVAAVLAGLHLVLFAAFALSLLSAAKALSAGLPACEGASLVAALERDRPADLARARAEAATVKHGAGLLWKVTATGGGVSYVYGTMHSPDPRVTTMTQAAESAFAGSSVVLVESTDALDRTAMERQMVALRELVFLKGETLDDLLPAGSLEKLRQTAEARGLPWPVARQMQPWMLAATIASSRCDLAAASAGLPVLDAVLAGRAKAEGKSLFGLETVREQFEAVAGVPRAFHVNGLADLAQISASTDDVTETTKLLYLSGETGLLLPLMRLLSPKAYEGEGYAEFQHRLIAARNRVMAERAATHLDAGGVFMAVGALHLPGEDGVLALLESRGYAVEAVPAR